MCAPINGDWPECSLGSGESALCECRIQSVSNDRGKKML